MSRDHVNPSRRSLLLGFAGALSALTLAACGANDQPQSEGDGAGFVSGDGTVTEWGPSERGAPVELTGVSMEGEEIDVASWRGAPVVINFWYANCPPCRAEAPDLVEVATELEPEGVRFLGVNNTDQPATALAFERTYEIPYPSLFDESSAGVAAMQGQVPLQAVPTTVVLDAQGRVSARVIGIVTASNLRTLVRDVLDPV